MVISPLIIVAVSAAALAFFLLAVVFHKNPHALDKLDKKKIDKLLKTEANAKDLVEKLNNVAFVQAAGSKLSNNAELEKLFRKAKNPWGLTPATYNFIRFGGLGLCTLFAMAFMPLLPPLSIAFAVFGVGCCFAPPQVYKAAAKEREAQWNQLYQFMWVIEHNLTYYDPKKTWFEVESYISKHSKSLTELTQGFHDFGTHWTGEGMDDYIKETYGEFPIPSQLFNIVQNAQETGEYPKNELDSLRTLIIQRMDFSIKETLSMVATRATLISTPCVLLTVSLIVLVPTAVNILGSFN